MGRREVLQKQIEDLNLKYEEKKRSTGKLANEYSEIFLESILKEAREILAEIKRKEKLLEMPEINMNEEILKRKVAELDKRGLHEKKLLVEKILKIPQSII
jgi:hypothetical protein